MEPTILILVVVLLVAVAVGGYLFWRGRAPTEEPYYHFRCPGCRRRLRYQARQAGRKGKCSNCGKDVTFPDASASID